MKVGRGSGGKAVSGPGAVAGLRENDARHVECPTCGAKRIARCVRMDRLGSYAAQSHEARRKAMKEAMGQ